MAIKHGMDCTDRRDADIAGQASYQEFPDFAGAPVGLLAFAGNHQPLDLLWQLIGVSDRTSGTVTQGNRAVLLVAIENLIASLPGDPEFSAQLGHRLAFQKPGNKT
jgi:hypothetical protein